MPAEMNLGTVSASLAINTAKWTAGLERARANLTTFSKTMDTEVATIRGQAVKIGEAFGAIGAGILYAAYKIDEAGSRMETRFLQIGANSGMSGKQIDDMREKIEALAENSPADIDELGEAWRRVVPNFHTAADVTEILTAAMHSAVATGGNVGDTADILGKMLHEYGLDAKFAADMMDMLHVAASRGNMTLEQLTGSGGPAFAMDAALMAKAGATQQQRMSAAVQAASAISALTKHGFTADEAATQIKDLEAHIINPQSVDALRPLGKAANVDLAGDMTPQGYAKRGLFGTAEDMKKAMSSSPSKMLSALSGTKVTAKEIKELGKIIGVDLSGMLKKGKIDTDEMHKAIKGLGDVAPIGAAGLMHIVPALRGFLGLFVLTTTGMKDWIDIGDQVSKAMAGELPESAEGYTRILQSQGAAAGILRNRFLILSDQISVIMLPIMKRLIDTVGDMVQWFIHLPKGVQTAIVDFTLFAGAAMLALFGVSKLIAVGETVAKLWEALKGISFVSSLVTKAGTIFAGFGETLAGVAEGIATVGAVLFELAGGWIPTVIAAVALLVVGWNKDWGHIREVTAAFFTWIRPAAQAVWKFIADAATAAWAWIVKEFETFWGYVKREFSAAVQDVTNWGKSVMKGITDGFEALINDPLAAIDHLIVDIENKFLDLLPFLHRLGPALANALESGLKGGGNGLLAVHDYLVNPIPPGAKKKGGPGDVPGTNSPFLGQNPFATTANPYTPPKYAPPADDGSGGKKKKENDGAAGQVLANHLLDAVNLPATKASCAIFASKIMEQAGLAVPYTEGAKNLVDFVKKHAEKLKTLADLQPGDFLEYHGPKYGGKQKGGGRSGYHVAFYQGEGNIRESNRPGRARTTPLYDPSHVTAYRLSDGLMTPRAQAEAAKGGSLDNLLSGENDVADTIASTVNKRHAQALAEAHKKIESWMKANVPGFMIAAGRKALMKKIYEDDNKEATERHQSNQGAILDTESARADATQDPALKALREHNLALHKLAVERQQALHAAKQSDYTGPDRANIEKSADAQVLAENARFNAEQLQTERDKQQQLYDLRKLSSDQYAAFLRTDLSNYVSGSTEQLAQLQKIADVEAEGRSRNLDQMETRRELGQTTDQQLAQQLAASYKAAATDTERAEVLGRLSSATGNLASAQRQLFDNGDASGAAALKPLNAMLSTMKSLGLTGTDAYKSLKAAVDDLNDAIKAAAVEQAQFMGDLKAQTAEAGGDKFGADRIRLQLDYAKQLADLQDRQDNGKISGTDATAARSALAQINAAGGVGIDVGQQLYNSKETTDAAQHAVEMRRLGLDAYRQLLADKYAELKQFLDTEKGLTLDQARQIQAQMDDITKQYKGAGDAKTSQAEQRLSPLTSGFESAASKSFNNMNFLDRMFGNNLGGVLKKALGTTLTEMFTDSIKKGLQAAATNKLFAKLFGLDGAPGGGASPIPGGAAGGSNPLTLLTKQLQQQTTATISQTVATQAHAAITTASTAIHATVTTANSVSTTANTAATASNTAATAAGGAGKGGGLLGGLGPWGAVAGIGLGLVAGMLGGGNSGPAQNVPTVEKAGDTINNHLDLRGAFLPDQKSISTLADLVVKKTRAQLATRN